MNSLEIREIKAKLIDMINEIALPLEVKRMILAEVMTELESATNREINSLLAEREEKKEKEDKQNEQSV